MSSASGAGLRASGNTSPPEGMLKISELAERSGVSAGTIKHYLREGVLGGGEEIFRTSRNMAYYPPDYVERIALVRRLQDERFMPLRVIRELLEAGPEQLARLALFEDRIIARAAEQGSRLTREEAEERYAMPPVVLDRLAEIGVLTPGRGGYDADDEGIIAAISRFRAGGYEQSLGFTVYDTLRYREALAPLVADEVSTLVTRVAAQVDVDRALAIIESGVEPLRDLIGAMHSKMLIAELRRQGRSRRG